MADRYTATEERSSAEIRREIERTRSHMDETVDRIGDKLSAARIVDEIWQRFRAGEGPAMLGEAVREHPRPFALMGLGLGLLAVEQTRERRQHDGHTGPGTYARAEGRVGPYRGEAVDHSDPDWEHAGTGTKLKGRMEDAAESVRDKASGKVESMKEKAQDVAHDARERVSDAARTARGKVSHAKHEVGERADDAASTSRAKARRGARRAREGFLGFMDENPLAAGALAFGLGLAGGVSAPSTDWEDERLGETARAVKDEARRVAKDATRRAKHVGEEAARAARQEVEHQRQDTGPLQVAVEQVKRSAREVGDAAREAARDRAESESLTAEGLKRDAREAGRRVRERSGTRSTEPG